MWREVRGLIRTMSRQNPLWGAPRIHGKLLKLGITIGETSVSKYMIRQRKPPSQTWRTFLDNHIQQLVSADFFTVPTIRFQVLYVFLVLAHERRRILHFHARLIPPRNGPPSNFAMRFPGTRHPVICCEIGTESLVTTSPDRSRTWAWRKCFPRRDRRGK